MNRWIGVVAVAAAIGAVLVAGCGKDDWHCWTGCINEDYCCTTPDCAARGIVECSSPLCQRS